MKKGPPAHTGYERKGNGGVVMQSLSEVKAGAVCTIKWMFGNPINVFQHGRDSMIIGMNNMRLAIGNEVAERIKV